MIRHVYEHMCQKLISLFWRKRKLATLHRIEIHTLPKNTGSNFYTLAHDATRYNSFAHLMVHVHN